MQVFISKLDKSIEVDFNALPETSRNYIIAYGLKQSLNDSIAAKEFIGEAAQGRIDERLDALRYGTIGVRSVSAPRDPVAAMAQSIIRDLLRKKGFKRDAKAPDAYNAKVAELALQPKIVALATAELARRATLEADLDLDI